MRYAFTHENDAQVAQLVEQRTENPRVGGSNPPLGTTLFPFPIIFELMARRLIILRLSL